jgi:hypothetical protein
MADPISIIQLTATILGMGSIIVGVFFSLLSLRNYNKSRNLSLFMQYHSQAGGKEFLADMLEVNLKWKWTDAEDFFKKYGPLTNPEAFAMFLDHSNYYDSIGLLLKTNNLSVDYLSPTMIVSIAYFWEKVEPIADAISAIIRRPNSYENVKFLYDQVLKHGLITKTYPK